MPLYEEMLSQFKDKSSLTTFCARWERDFPQEKGKGILFVGRVLNGGKANANLDINVLYDENIKGGIEWTEKNMSQSKNQKKYNVNNSAFWRIIKGITQNAYHIQNNWSSQIAWTNLYKISPFEGGNPTREQEKIQLPYCKAILKAEIEILQPQFVIFLTSGKEKEFIWDNFGKTGHSIESKSWGKKGQYTTKLYKVNDMYFITSYHPQGKPDKEHIKIISEIIKDKLII